MNEDYSIIYKKFAKYIPLNEMKGLQWFALTSNYGTTYGDITKKYHFKEKPKLLDIGNANVRSMIKETIKPYDKNIIKYSDPNEQYSGGVMNKKYHDLVKQYFGEKYDGTIIDEENLQGNDEYPEEELEGPTEIVLWKNYPELLEEVDFSGGFKKKSRKARKARKLEKTRKTKKTRKTRKIKKNKK